MRIGQIGSGVAFIDRSYWRGNKIVVNSKSQSGVLLQLTSWHHGLQNAVSMMGGEQVATHGQRPPIVKAWVTGDWKDHLSVS